MNPFDPTIVHPGECRTCYAWVRDNETMTDGECATCAVNGEEDDDDRRCNPRRL
jgi:hypothetical protein